MVIFIILTIFVILLMIAAAVCSSIAVNQTISNQTSIRKAYTQLTISTALSYTVAAILLVILIVAWVIGVFNSNEHETTFMVVFVSFIVVGIVILTISIISGLAATTLKNTNMYGLAIATSSTSALAFLLLLIAIVMFWSQRKTEKTHLEYPPEYYPEYFSEYLEYAN